MIFDHIGFAVSAYARSRIFYTTVLAPLGIGVVKEGENWALMGRPGRGQFWFGAFGTPPGRIHLAFAATSEAQVRKFHATALAAGAADNGAPGLRIEYDPDYYAAFVIDPNGHNIEAVCHLPRR
jgi:catechol 2,3-dioxygenase-like lactoylglutathione lyase family enzyme